MFTRKTMNREEKFKIYNNNVAMKCVIIIHGKWFLQDCSANLARQFLLGFREFDIFLSLSHHMAEEAMHTWCIVWELNMKDIMELYYSGQHIRQGFNLELESTMYTHRQLQRHNLFRLLV